MHRNDITFAIICGLMVAWIALDFFGVYGLALFFILPALSVAGLQITYKISARAPFVRQAGRFFLTGAFADVIDIKVFQFLFFLAPFSLFFKSVSFLTATAVKYWINRHWTFEKTERENMKREVAQFFLITLVGLGINIVSFYYFGKIKTGLAPEVWTEACIILAALASAIWNFLGYKFIVFKK